MLRTFTSKSGVDARDDIALLDHIADIYRQGDQRTRNPKGKLDLLGGRRPPRPLAPLELPGIGHLGGANRPDDFFLRRLLFGAAAEQRGGEQQANGFNVSINHSCSLASQGATAPKRRQPPVSGEGGHS